jgi:hypothetical protein
MQTIEDATKSVDSHIALKNAKGATADARELEELFAQVEAYYVRKGDADDAVAFSRKSRESAAALAKFVASNDFEAASQTTRDITRTCKTCHNVYKS